MMLFKDMQYWREVNIKVNNNKENYKFQEKPKAV